MVFVVMGFTAVQTIAVWLFYGLQCIPLGTFFNPTAYPEGHCVPTPLTLYIPASLVSDHLHPIPYATTFSIIDLSMQKLT